MTRSRDRRPGLDSAQSGEARLLLQVIDMLGLINAKVDRLAERVDAVFTPRAAPPAGSVHESEDSITKAQRSALRREFYRWLEARLEADALVCPDGTGRTELAEATYKQLFKTPAEVSADVGRLEELTNVRVTPSVHGRLVKEWLCNRVRQATGRHGAGSSVQRKRSRADSGGGGTEAEDCAADVEDAAIEGVGGGAVAVGRGRGEWLTTAFKWGTAGDGLPSAGSVAVSTADDGLP